MLLFSLLAWGELAQVELMDLKVVELLVGCGGTTVSEGNKSADGEYGVCE